MGINREEKKTAAGSGGEVICCIQARMGSVRLPGKAMADICGRPLIEHIIIRLKRCRSLSRIVLLTSTAVENDVFEPLCTGLGVDLLRGDENDVLSRFISALERYSPGHVVRVCADNPLIDPVEVDRIVAHHLSSGADYSFNDVPARGNNYPDGVGAAVFSSGALLESASKATGAAEREHVNKYILDHPERFDIRTIQAPPEIADPSLSIRLDVDTAQDLEKVRKIYDHFKGHDFFTADILAMLRENKPCR